MEMPANGLTKPLPRQKHEQFVKLPGMERLSLIHI